MRHRKMTSENRFTEWCRLVLSYQAYCITGIASGGAENLRKE